MKENNDNSSNCLAWIAISLSVLAVIISGVATCIAAYRTPELGFDYQGVLVGILALLVTTLIGWQIYNIIYVEERVKKSIGNTLGNLNKKIESSTDAAKEEAIGTSLFNLGQVMFHNGLYEFALDNFIKSVGAITKSNMDKKEVHIQNTINAIMVTINRMKKDVDRDKYTIPEGTVASYSDLLLRLHDKRIFDIMEFVKGMKRRPD